MTDQNTAMMREVFKWLSKYEHPPIGQNEDWWAAMSREAGEIYNRYQTPLTRHLLYGIIDGHSEQYRVDMINLLEKRNAEGHQLQMEVYP